MSPEEVALLAVKALRRAPAIIIPGWRNRLFACAVRLLPRWALRKLAGRVNRLALAG